MDESVKISFDKEYKIRVLDAEKFARGEELEKECGTFTEKISTFNEKVNKLVDILESHAKRIDSQKLRAIGLRIATEHEADQRKIQKRAIDMMINEKRAELDRYNIQLQALQRIESEQKAALEKMSTN
jgi:intraflagellar transport protein 20